MTVQPHYQVFCEPLRVGHVRRDGAVAVYTPDGVRMMLTADAVARSAESLARAAQEADALVPHTPAAVIAGRFPNQRRTWRMFLQQVRQTPGLRTVFTAALVPLVWVVLGAFVFALFVVVIGSDAARRILPWVVFALGPVAPIAAWIAAGRMLFPGKRRNRLRVGFQPRVITGTPR